ncbi:hypothetical protein KFE25_010516 [Diacronema lutheri]|uniref:Uncharacterized protein n=2 Tax=Diacronema lutheri TaxID=2081491 RepID=A0A8J5XIL4_DIALT|nr:hypothetical protein KFE25_010516 [Diacronema lutheri]
MRGLREQTRSRMLEVFRSLHIHDPGGVLLCDKLALRAVSCACRVSEIMEEGITLVESLDIKRQPIREFAAVYLITPTVAAVNMMLADFADPRNPAYGDVHILFTSHLPDALLAKVKTSPIVGRVKTFRELNFEYLAIESGAFTLDAPDALASVFSPSSTAAVPEQHKAAAQLSTLFAMYGEMPYVRFAAKGHPSSSSFAYIVQEKLERLGQASGCFARAGTRSTDRPTLLIVDRTIDTLAPLLHEYSYQAMIHDLLPIADGERYAYRYTSNRGEELRKDVLLNETDPLWPTLRHMHIADAIEYLTTNFNQFLAANQSATKLGKKGGEVGLREMSEALRGMPQYQEEMARYSLHISLTRELMARFKTNQLEAVSTLEQNMALGEDSDGKEVKGTKLVEQLIEMVRRDVSPQDKMRLLMIYIISQEGIRDDDRRRLMDAAGLSPDDQAAIVNLFYLGVTLSRGASKATASRRKTAGGAKGSDAASYDLSRYTPVLKRLVEDVLTNAAPLAAFPYVKDRPASAASAGAGATISPADVSLDAARRPGAQPEPSWATRGRSKKEDASTAGPRLVVFVLGGATYSELKCCYELAKAHQREVVAGSTSMLTPYQFIHDLKRFKKLDPFAD